jgi:hypothetical protein
MALMSGAMCRYLHLSTGLRIDVNSAWLLELAAKWEFFVSFVPCALRPLRRIHVTTQRHMRSSCLKRTPHMIRVTASQSQARLEIRRNRRGPRVIGRKLLNLLGRVKLSRTLGHVFVANIGPKLARSALDMSATFLLLGDDIV